MQYLFFDTEATGQPKNWKAPVTDLHNWPRLVQLAWKTCDAHGAKIAAHQYIIKPEGYFIRHGTARLPGITHESAIKNGVGIRSVLKLFAEDIAGSDLIIAHNMGFSAKMVGAEFLRTNLPHQLFEKEQLCTMKKSTAYCRIPGKYGNKWPTLDELHTKLFESGPAKGRDIAADLETCSKCFFELRKKKVI